VFRHEGGGGGVFRSRVWVVECRKEDIWSWASPGYGLKCMIQEEGVEVGTWKMKGGWNGGWVCAFV